MKKIFNQKAEVLTPEEKGEGWQTAIKRNSPSTPMRHILCKFYGEQLEIIQDDDERKIMEWDYSPDTEFVGLEKLDYGCGRGQDADFFEMDKYDPNWGPKEFPSKSYDLITCNYVLNVILDDEEREEALVKIESLLKPDGVAYISVRSDIKEDTEDQRVVFLELPLVRKNGNFRMYKLVKGGLK